VRERVRLPESVRVCVCESDFSFKELPHWTFPTSSKDATCTLEMEGAAVYNTKKRFFSARVWVSVLKRKRKCVRAFWERLRAC
jgi:hypothetical protein